MPQNLIHDFHSTQNNIQERYVQMSSTSNPGSTPQTASLTPLRGAKRGFEGLGPLNEKRLDENDMPIFFLTQS